MTNIVFQLPRAKPKAIERNRFIGTHLDEANYTRLKQIANHLQVSLSELLRSYVELGIRVTAEKLKGEREK